MSQTPPVLSETIDGLCRITLNRPERRNALTAQLVSQLHEAVRAADQDPDVHAVLLHGAGGCFCSGLDLKDPNFADVRPLWQDFHRMVAHAATPIIGALEMAAINAGAALALACDVLIVGETAKFQVMEAQLGMTPPVNLAWMQVKLPVSQTLRLTLTCQPLTGDEIVQAGIGALSIADDNVLEASEQLARTIAGYPKDAARAIKRMVRSHGEATSNAFDDALDRVLNAAQ